LVLAATISIMAAPYLPMPFVGHGVHSFNSIYLADLATALKDSRF